MHNVAVFSLGLFGVAVPRLYNMPSLNFDVGRKTMPPTMYLMLILPGENALLSVNLHVTIKHRICTNVVINYCHSLTTSRNVCTINFVSCL